MCAALLLLLRRVLGALLVSAGLLVGVVGLSVSAVLAWLWARGQTTTAGDGRAALVGLLALLLGAGALWAGTRLWPGRRSGAAPAAPTPASRKPRHPAWVAGLWMLIAAQGAYVWAAEASFGPRLGYTLLAAGAVFCGLHAVVAAHELGHLGAAALLGRDLLRFQVGAGPRLLGADLGRCGQLRLEWRLWPSVGVVHAADGRPAGWRRRSWLFSAAGPLAHAGLLAAGAWALTRGGLPPWGGAAGSAWPGPALRLAGLFALVPGALLLVDALVPRAGWVAGMATRSDGFWLLRLPCVDQAFIETAVISGLLARVERVWTMGRWAQARALLREVLARFPGRAILAVAEGHFLLRGGEPRAAAETLAAKAAEGRTAGWPLLVRLRIAYEEAHARLLAGQPERARALCVEFLAGVTEPAERAEALDTFACVVTHHGHRDLLAAADAWSAEMLALEPGVLTRQVTRGAVLVELGRAEEAAVMLQHVWERSGGEADAAVAAFGLARLARARGDRAAFKRWRQRARRFAAHASAGLAARIAGPELADIVDGCPERERPRTGEVARGPVPLPAAAQSN